MPRNAKPRKQPAAAAARKRPTPTERFDAMTATEKEVARLFFGLPAERKPRAVARVVPKARTADKPFKRIQVTLDVDLLARADAYAKQHGMTRSQLIAAGLRLAMASGVTAGTA